MPESLLNFLTKVVETSPQLILIFFGVAIVAISGADQLPIGSASIVLSKLIKLVLFAIGSSLIVFSMWTLYGNESFRRVKLKQDKDNLAEELKKLEETVLEQKQKITELESTIDQAIKVAQEKDLGEIVRILSKVNIILMESQEKFKPLLDAASWVDLKIDKWIEEIELPQGYEDYGITVHNVEDFRKEIVEHLKLLANNLREMIPDTIPRLCKVPQGIAKNRLAYVKALKSIQTQLEKDLRKDNELSDIAREQLSMYMNTLIDKSTA